MEKKTQQRNYQQDKLVYRHTSELQLNANRPLEVWTQTRVVEISKYII